MERKLPPKQPLKIFPVLSIPEGQWGVSWGGAPSVSSRVMASLSTLQEIPTVQDTALQSQHSTLSSTSQPCANHLHLGEPTVS